MRFKTTLVFLGILAAAAVLFFVLERPRHERALERSARQGRFADVSPGDVRRVTIVRPGDTIEAERDEDRWTLVRPIADRADESAVKTLLETVCTARAEKEFDAGDSPLSEFGLDEPSAVLSLAGGSGDNLLELRIGDLSLTKSECYAALPGEERVLLLPADVRRYALRPLFDYRYKRIFDLPVSGVRLVEIASPSRSMIWRAEKPGLWFTVQNGDTIPGDSASVESIVRTLRGLRAKEIPFGAPGPSGGYLAAKAGSVSVGLNPDSADVTLSFSVPIDKGCYVESSANHRVALVDTTVLDVFLESIATLRDRRLFRSDADAAVRMTIETPSFAATLVKADARWAFENPQFGNLDGETARRLVSRIQGVKFDAVVDERLPAAVGYGFEEPALRLTLIGPLGRAIDELVVGDAAPNGYSRYAWSHSTRALTTIDDVSLTEFERSLGVPTAP